MGDQTHKWLMPYHTRLVVQMRSSVARKAAPPICGQGRLFDQALRHNRPDPLPDGYDTERYKQAKAERLVQSTQHPTDGDLKLAYMMLYTQQGTQFGDRRNHAPESLRYSQHFETPESKAHVRSFLEMHGIPKRFSELGYDFDGYHGWLYKVDATTLDSYADSSEQKVLLGYHPDGTVKNRLTLFIENVRGSSALYFKVPLPNATGSKILYGAQKKV